MLQYKRIKRQPPPCSVFQARLLSRFIGHYPWPQQNANYPPLLALAWYPVHLMQNIYRCFRATFKLRHRPIDPSPDGLKANVKYSRDGPVIRISAPPFVCVAKNPDLSAAIKILRILCSLVYVTNTIQLQVFLVNTVGEIWIYVSITLVFYLW